MSLAVGQSFFTPENNSVSRHLWIVASDPAADGQVVIVNLSSKPPPALEPPESPASIGSGEHPSAGQRCYIRCDEACVRPAAKIEELLAKGTLSPTRDAPTLLVQKIQAALLSSRHTQLDIKAVLRAQGHNG